MPKATREAGPATAADDDDIPTRAELVQALVNLRVKSEAEYIEWQRLEGMNYISAAKDAKAAWESTSKRLDSMITGIELVDLLSA